MTAEKARLFEELGAVRRRTIALYVKLAALTDAAEAGFKARDPDAPDMTLELIKRAWDAHPEKARGILRQIIKNDVLIDDLLLEVIEA